ncbi:MAG: hypothetical protein ACR2K2_02405 [Mycobacteriales bacterium]
MYIDLHLEGELCGPAGADRADRRRLGHAVNRCGHPLADGAQSRAPRRVRRRVRPGQAAGQPHRVRAGRSFSYDELIARDKANLDITWLRDDSLKDLDNLPAPEVIAREIVEDLTVALVEFEAVAAALEAAAAPAEDVEP